MRHHSLVLEPILWREKGERQEATPAQAVIRPGRTLAVACRCGNYLGSVAGWGPRPRFPYSVFNIG